MGRSFIHFTSLKLLHSKMNDQELAQQVAVMPCLIAVIKTNHFDDAIGFLDLMSDLQGNSVKSTKKYVVLITPQIDEQLIQNKTGNINVHIISEGE